MAGFSDWAENWILDLIYTAVAQANWADNAATTPETNIDNALHTADPTDSGNMSSSETAYTSYARTAVARTTGGWTVTNNSVSPVSAIAFPAGTGGGDTASFWSTGVDGGGAANILGAGSVSPTIATGNGVTPQLSTSSTIVLD